MSRGTLGKSQTVESQSRTSRDRPTEAKPFADCLSPGAADKVDRASFANAPGCVTRRRLSDPPPPRSMMARATEPRRLSRSRNLQVCPERCVLQTPLDTPKFAGGTSRLQSGTPSASSKLTRRPARVGSRVPAKSPLAIRVQKRNALVACRWEARQNAETARLASLWCDAIAINWPATGA